MGLREFLRELSIALAVATLLLFLVGHAAGGCAHEGPSPGPPTDFLDAPARA